MVPHQSMQVVKGDQKWVPGAWRGTAGPPCPGGYKYGALRMGGWVTGRQPVTVKRSKLLGNQSCGLGAVRLSGIDLEEDQ